MMTDPQKQVLDLTTRGAKLFTSQLNRELHRHGLTKSSWLALYYIQKRHHTSQHTLADLLGIKGPSLVKIIAKLLDEKLITVTRSPSDKRERILSLTPEGIEKARVGLPIVQSYQRKITKSISTKDLETTLSVLKQMIVNAQHI